VALFLHLFASLVGFTLGFSLVWFVTLNPLWGFLAGALGAFFVFAWVRRLSQSGLAPWALERLAMRLAAHRGATDAQALSKAAGIPEDKAEEVLDGLFRRGILQKEGGRYRYPR